MLSSKSWTAEPLKKLSTVIRNALLALRRQQMRKIYICGKSSIDLQGIIKSSLNVDVSCFANSGKIFVCKSCYKRLTKCQRSSEKLNEIRQEIEEAFKKRDVPRTKRLQRASEELHGNIPEGNHQDQVRDMSRTQKS